MASPLTKSNENDVLLISTKEQTLDLPKDQTIGGEFDTAEFQPARIHLGRVGSVQKLTSGTDIAQHNEMTREEMHVVESAGD